MQYGLSLRADRVIPFAVKIITRDPDAGHLLVSNFYLRRVILAVQNAADFKTGLRARVRYQVHNGSVRHQRFAAPVLSNIGKQAMFNLVPFAGPRRQAADRNFKTCLIGQLLQFPLPKTYARSITSTAIGRDRVLLNLFLYRPLRRILEANYGLSIQTRKEGYLI